MYVIERDMPGLGQMNAEQLKAASQKSCSVLSKLGPQVKWLHSYVTGNKMYCVYLAPNEEMVREHAKLGGFPATAVNRVSTIIGPQTAKEESARKNPNPQSRVAAFTHWPGIGAGIQYALILASVATTQTDSPEFV